MQKSQTAKILNMPRRGRAQFFNNVALRGKCGAERQVVGQMLPRCAAMAAGGHNIQVAGVDAVKAEHRQASGKGFRAAALAGEYFV